jgi:hypothetical protein
MSDFKKSQNSLLFEYFFPLLVLPTRTIKKILADQLSFKRLTIFLLIVSILRGILEGAWILLKEGQFFQIIISPVLMRSYMDLGFPFILSSMTCGYVRWAGFAFLPCLLAKFWGKEVRYKDFLRVTGVFMGLYVVTILPNFAYVFLKFPMIKFNVSQVYNPAIGLGQWMTAIWLVCIIYKASRVIHGLSSYQAFLCGISVLLVNMGALVFGSLVFFNLSYFKSFSFRSSLNIATFIFIGVTILTIPVFFWFGSKLTHSKRMSQVKNSGFEKGVLS